MKYVLPPLFLLIMAAPAVANDHQWHYDSTQWEADLARGHAMARLVRCEEALLAEARREFIRIDQQSLSVHLHGLRSPVAAQPILPRPAR